MAQGPTTMVEALSKVVSDLSQAMVAPDADLPFLTSLQGIIVGRMRQGMGPGGSPSQGMGGQPGGPAGGQSPSPGGPPPGAGPGGPPQGMPQGGGAPPGAPMQGPPTPNGVQALAQAPNPDELRRMLAQRSGA